MTVTSLGTLKSDKWRGGSALVGDNGEENDSGKIAKLRTGAVRG
jgi:hypothetical protein